MSTIPFIVFVLAAAALIGPLAWRDHRALRTQRRQLLDACSHLLKDPTVTLGGDDFPRLRGHLGAHAVHVELIPDTMTIRRLPQLWLSLTLLDRLPVAGDFAVLVRPSGCDFYSLTERFTHFVAPPASFPWEVLIRGSDERCEPLLERLAGPISALLADPRIKEVAVTAKGLRIVRQAGEGRRGEHLLLRQAMFDDADVKSAELSDLFDKLAGLHREILKTSRELAVA